MKRKVSLITITLLISIFCTLDINIINAQKNSGDEEIDSIQQRVNDVEQYTMNEDGELVAVDVTSTSTETEEELKIKNNQYARQRAGNVYVVKLRTKASANYNTNFTYDGGSGYINGYYGGDAACIQNNGSNINFMIAGVNGIMQNSDSNYKLIPFSEAKSVSYYTVTNGLLYHYVAQDVEVANSWFAVNNLGAAPSYLKANTKYYSYDGHYFYTDYATMINNYQQVENRDNAVNVNNPYYNYYQFLTVRTTSNLSVDEVYQYIASKHPGGALANRSTIQAFFDGQEKYGINALLAIAHAALESNWGKSNYAINRHNLFGINAGDSNPDDASYYSSDAACINAYMNMISKYYMNPNSSTYHGGHYGDKASGIGVSYASNAYGGELISELAMEIDTSGKDLNSYTIGINEFTDLLNIRSSYPSGNILYNTKTYDFYPFTILGTEGNWYKIQTDPVLNSARTEIDSSTGTYSFTNSYGFVSSSYVKKVIEGTAGGGKDTSNVVGEPTGKLESEPTLFYRANSQKIGWLDYMNEPNTAGTTGRSLALYQLQFNFKNSSKSSNLSAKIYNTSGWNEYENIESNTIVGEKNKAMQVVNFNLVNQPGYRLQYRVHSANIGWQSWTDQGNNAGVIGNDIQAIDFRLIKDTTMNYQDSGLYYQGHVSEIGWLSYVPSSQIAGTIGESIGLQAIKVGFENESKYNLKGYAVIENGSIVNFDSNGETTIGTTGKGLSLKGINIQLSGITGYKLQYSVHLSNLGWQAWTDQGVIAGNVGTEQIEAVKLRLIADTTISSVSLNKTKLTLVTNASEQLLATINPTNTTDDKSLSWTSSDASVASVDSKGAITAKKEGTTTITVKTSNNKVAQCIVTVINALPSVKYSTHIQDIGWQTPKEDGEVSGTSGLSKRLEGIKIELANVANGNIEYSTHIQDIGWQAWKKDGQLSGTSGQSKRLEAIKIRLTGKIAENYDVYYRVHAQEFGWLDWAKNGENAGTAGYSYRLEAIQIVLVKKGEQAPGNTDSPYIQEYVKYKTHIQDIGWQVEKNDGATSGTIGQSKRLEAISLNLSNPEYDGSIEYKTHIQDIGWQSWKKDGQVSGTNGQSKRLEAIQIRLTSEMANKYDIYYRVHAQEFGWLGWAKNGEPAGSEGYSYRLEAIQVKLVPKGESAPGSTANAFKKK